MAFVDYDKVVVAPIQSFEINAVALATVACEVGVKEHIISQAVGSHRIGVVVVAECLPVLVQLLRA